MKKIMFITASILAISCSPVSAHDAPMSAHHEAGLGKLFVSATGRAAQAPDQATVSAGVVSQGRTAGDAMRQNAGQMNAAYNALKASGIAQRDIQTSQMSLRPQYDYQDRKAPVITGYEVRNTVTARTNDLNRVGAMLDSLVSAGVNNINGVTFSIRDSGAAKNKARIDAIGQAKAKAEGMARAAGVRLGRILEIRENTNSFNPQPQMMMARSMEGGSAPTPISAGEQTLSVTVNITYALQ